MRRLNKVKYMVTDMDAINVVRINSKSDAYRQATGNGCGVVDSAILVNNQGEQCSISPDAELDQKEWFKQTECSVILMSDSHGFSFWEKEKGLVKIFATHNAISFLIL